MTTGIVTTTSTGTTTFPPAPTRGRLFMPYEAYLDLDYEGGIVEWVNGEVIFHDMPTHTHQTVIEFLHILLGLFVRLHQMGLVRIAAYPMRAKEGGSGREPDVLFVTNEHMDRVTEKQLKGPADLAVEVVSDDSTTRDRRDKFSEYEEAGIREYWIIDPRPNRHRAAFYVLDEEGHYQPAPVNDGIYRSTVVPGFFLRVEWLWQDAPDPLTALAEIVGAERLIETISHAIINPAPPSAQGVTSTEHNNL